MKTLLESWTLGTVLQIGYIEQDENYITFWISSVVIAVPEYVAITEILNVNSVRYKISSVKCLSKLQPKLSVITQAFNKLTYTKVVNSEVSQGLLGKNELINVPGWMQCMNGWTNIGDTL
jgi:hypothetical protein